MRETSGRRGTGMKRERKSGGGGLLCVAGGKVLRKSAVPDIASSVPLSSGPDPAASLPLPPLTIPALKYVHSSTFTSTFCAVRSVVSVNRLPFGVHLPAATRLPDLLFLSAFSAGKHVHVVRPSEAF